MKNKQTNQRTILILYFKAVWMAKCKVNEVCEHVLNLSVGGKIDPASQSQ